MIGKVALRGPTKLGAINGRMQLQPPISPAKWRQLFAVDAFLNTSQQNACRNFLRMLISSKRTGF